MHQQSFNKSLWKCQRDI